MLSINFISASCASPRSVLIHRKEFPMNQKRSHEISYTRGGVPLRVTNVSLYGSNIRNICTLSQ